MTALQLATLGQVRGADSVFVSTLDGANISSTIDSAIEDVIIIKAEVLAGHLDIAMDKLDSMEEHLLSLRGNNARAIIISEEVTTPISTDNEAVKMGLGSN